MKSVALREGLLDIPREPEGLLDSLDGPTIFRVAGRDRARTRIVSALVHGNEPSGLVAVHAALRSKERPQADTLFFVGAVAAAKAEPRFSRRMLPGRRDLNRCFRAPFEGIDGAVAREALEAFTSAAPEAVVDLHNNSGHNPAYGVGVFVDPGRLGVASLFAERYVHSTIALGALMEVFPRTTPMVTVECGRAGDAAANERAIAGLSRFLALDRLPRGAPSAGSLDIFVDPVRVEIARDVSFTFGEAKVAGVDVTIDERVDRHNFQDLEAAATIGWTTSDEVPFVAYRGDGTDRARELFEAKGGVLRTRRPLIPIMMTTSATSAREDCLFYACSRLRVPRARRG
jgi:hypothetical protein